MKANEFLSLLRKDRQNALSWLYQTCYMRLFRSACCYLGSYEDAEDLAQEVFADVTDHIESFRGNSGVYTWVYSIYLNKARDYHRKHDSEQSEQRNQNLAVLTREKLKNSDPVSLSEQKDIQNGVIDAVQNLPEDMKTLVIMRYYDKLTGEEMAEILGLSHARVRSRLSEARAMLRNLVAAKEIV